MSLQARVDNSNHASGLLSDIWGYEKGGNEYAIVGARQGIYIYDVTDCAGPALEMDTVDGFYSSWRDFKVYGDYAYGVCDGANCGLQIINLNDYTMTTSFDTLLRAHNLFIDVPNARMYAVGTLLVNGVDRNTILIYDVSTPSAPTLVNAYDAKKYTHDIYVEDNIMYCSHGYSGLGTYEYNPLNDEVTSIASVDGSSGYNHSSWKHPNEDVLFLAEEVPIGRPLFIYDVGNLGQPMGGPSIIGEFSNPLLAPTHTANRAHNPFVHGDYLYVSYYHDGLQVWDVTDPINPESIGYFDTYYQNTSYTNNYPGAWGTYPYLSSGCILVSDINNGFYTIKLDEYTGYSTLDGDIYLQEAGAGIVFKDSSGVYQKVSVFGGSLTVGVTGAPTPTDQMLMNSHLEMEVNSGRIFTDGNGSGNMYRLRILSDVPTLFPLPNIPPDQKLLTVSQGDFYIDRKNSGLIFYDSGTCFKFYTDNSGNIRAPEYPCIPD